LEVTQTLQSASNKYDMDFIIFICNNPIIKPENFDEFDNKRKSSNLLLISGKDADGVKNQHLMYIKNVEALKISMYPKCYWVPSGSDHGHYNKERFEDHISKCDGKRFTEVKLNNCSKPHAKYLFSNPTYAYLFVYKRLNEYKFLSDFITFNFETMTEIINEKY
jgi:hypothetical protein